MQSHWACLFIHFSQLLHAENKYTYGHKNTIKTKLKQSFCQFGDEEEQHQGNARTRRISN